MAISSDVVRLFLEELAARSLPTPERQKDGSFRLELNGFTITINLDNLAKDYTTDRDRGRITRFVDQIVASANPQPVPGWAEARDAVRLVVEPADYDFGDAIREPVSDSVCRVLALARPGDAGILWLTPWMLADWGKSREEVEEVARRNMARLLEETEFHIEQNDKGRLGFFHSNSPFKASLLFSPNIKEVLGPKLGWPLLMVIPNRDFAYLFREEDRDLLPAVGAVVVEQFRTGAYPISTEVFRLSDDGIEAIGTFQAPSEEDLQAARDAEEGMKLITYRGGIVCFRIPEHWEEEYEEEGGGAFYDEDEPGTLRLNVLTVEGKADAGPEMAVQILKKRAREKGRKVKRLPNGNAVLAYSETSEEGDEAVRVWYWEIVNPLPPRHARIALFTYTVDEADADDPDTAEQVAMLERELERCEFAQELGE